MAWSPARFSSTVDAQAEVYSDDGYFDDEEPGEVITSSMPLRVGEERALNASGLCKTLLKEGYGSETPENGDEVTVHYVGKLVDGIHLDTSRNSGTLITYRLGRGVGPNKRLEDGILTMKTGELALFTWPCNVGPAGTHFCYEVELISWLTMVDICKDGGIVKKILSTGYDMQAGELDEVTVNYQVRLLDGPIVAESPEGGVEFYVNEGHLCPAFSKIVKSMRRGEKASVNVQPQYSFGEGSRGADGKFPSMPPNAPLLIDIELVNFKPVIDITGDKKILKKIVKVGEGIRTPNDGEIVQIRYTAMLATGTVFEKFGYDGVLYEFAVDAEQVVNGLDRSIATMLKGEVSQLTVMPDYGYGNEEVMRDLAAVPSYSTLIYDVELVDFIKEKEFTEMSISEKIEAAEKMKKMGNDLFSVEKFKRAAKKYDKAVNYVCNGGPFRGHDEKLVKALRVSCWLNHAACCLKLNEFQEAIELCSKVLDIELCNTKALYRRAKAYIKIDDLNLAESDVKRALKVDPDNKEVKSLQATLKQLQPERKRRDAKFCAKMFKRMKQATNMAMKRLKISKPDDEGPSIRDVQEDMDIETSVV